MGTASPKTHTREPHCASQGGGMMDEELDFTDPIDLSG